MERRNLGAKGPEISVIGYGAWEAGGSMWGEEIGDDEVLQAMHAAADAGVSWIDTAEAYGDGRSEELAGRFLAQRNDEILVFTKVAHFVSGSRPEDVHRAIRGSLRRLGVDHVDCYQIHWPDEEHVPVEETWGAMAEVQDQGLARYIGVSNFDLPLVERCLEIRHVDSVQNQFSLLHRDDAHDLLPWLADRGVGYLAYGPLAFGMLTGAITRETTFGPDDWRSGSEWDLGYYHDLFAPGVIDRQLERVERLKGISDRTGVDLPTLALRAAVDTPGVTGAIAGSRNARHVEANARAGDLFLGAATLREVEAAVEG